MIGVIHASQVPSMRAPSFMLDHQRHNSLTKLLHYYIQKDRWKNELTDGQIARWTDSQMEGQTARWRDRQTGGETDRQMERQTETDRQRDKQTDKQTDR